MILMGNLHAGGHSDTGGLSVLVHRNYKMLKTSIFIVGIFVAMDTCCTIQIGAIFASVVIGGQSVLI